MLEVNTTAAREHVAEIERGLCTIQERGRGIVSTLPFTHLPMQVVIHLVYFVVLWLNAMPHEKEGISDTLSPMKLFYAGT